MNEPVAGAAQRGIAKTARIPIRVEVREALPKPPWIRVRVSHGEGFGKVKRLLREAQSTAVHEAILREAAHFGPRLAGAEAREAIAAIIEKRRPDFSRFA